MAPSLVTCPTRSVVTPWSFATRVSRAVDARTCPTDPAARARTRRSSSGSSRPPGTSARSSSAGPLDRLDDRRGKQADVPAAAQAVRTHPHLCRRLLAAHVEHAHPAQGEGIDDLQQQRGLPDPGSPRAAPVGLVLMPSSAFLSRTRVPARRARTSRSSGISSLPTRASCRYRCSTCLNGGVHADKQRRPPGVHDRAGERGILRRGPADGSGDLPRAQGRLKERGYGTAVGDEGGFAPTRAPTSRPWSSSRGDRNARASDLARTSSSRSTPRRASSSRTAHTSSRSRTRAGARPRDGGVLEDWVRQYPMIASIEDASPRTTTRAGACSPSASGRRSSWSATTIS